MDGITRDIILATVIGDALGYTLEGMGKGHIRARFGTIDDYIDPAPALKGKLHRWRKPGLYSSISQLMLILGSYSSRRGPFLEPFIRSVREAPPLPGAPAGIFRGAGIAEQRFINADRENLVEHTPPDLPSARIIPSLAPLSFRDATDEQRIKDVLGYLRLYTMDYSTHAAGLVYAFLLRLPGHDGAPGGDLIEESMETASRLAGMVEADPAAVFEGSINPDALHRELLDLRETFAALCVHGDIEDLERIIIRMVSPHLTTPLARASVDMPGALVPFAVVISSRGGDPGVLFRAVSHGGAAAALGAMTGALSAARYGAGIVPEAPARSLINRKRIVSLTEALGSRRVPPSLPGEFILAEASLTGKEAEERAARCRHGGSAPPAKKIPGPAREAALSRHVVESWTKLDKSRWKRERKRKPGDEES